MKGTHHFSLQPHGPPSRPHRILRLGQPATFRVSTGDRNAADGPDRLPRPHRGGDAVPQPAIRASRGPDPRRHQFPQHRAQRDARFPALRRGVQRRSEGAPRAGLAHRLPGDRRHDDLDGSGGRRVLLSQPMVRPRRAPRLVLRSRRTHQPHRPGRRPRLAEGRQDTAVHRGRDAGRSALQRRRRNRPLHRLPRHRLAFRRRRHRRERRPHLPARDRRRPRARPVSRLSSPISPCGRSTTFRPRSSSRSPS